MKALQIMQKQILLTLFIILWPMRTLVLAKLMRDYCELDLIDKDKTGALVKCLSAYCQKRYTHYKQRKSASQISVEMEEAKKFDKYMKTLLAHEALQADGFDEELRKKLYKENWPEYQNIDQRDGKWLQKHAFLHVIREWMVMGGSTTRAKRNLDAEQLQRRVKHITDDDESTSKTREEPTKVATNKATALGVSPYREPGTLMSKQGNSTTEKSKEDEDGKLKEDEKEKIQ